MAGKRLRKGPFGRNNAVEMHFFAKIFAYVKKKQYLCTRFCEKASK